MSSSNTCLGITKKGTACKKKTSFGQYCRFHASTLFDDDAEHLDLHKKKKSNPSDIHRQLRDLKDQVSSLEKVLQEQKSQDKRPRNKKSQLRDDDP